MPKIIKDTIIAISIILLFGITVIVIMDINMPQPDIVIHKVISYNQYSIVIISYRKSWIRAFPDRKLNIDIWSNNKKINSYHIYNLSVAEDYDYKIKDVTILADSNEVRVEFDGSGGISADGKSRTGVGLYKIVDD